MSPQPRSKPQTRKVQGASRHVPDLRSFLADAGWEPPPEIDDFKLRGLGDGFVVASLSRENGELLLRTMRWEPKGLVSWAPKRGATEMGPKTRALT